MLLRTITKATKSSPTPFTLISLHYTFQITPQSQLYNKHLQNKTNKILTHPQQNFKFESVIVPRKLTDFEQINTNLLTKWKQKKILLNVDTSALIGTKRLTMRNYLEENVVKDSGVKVNSLFSEINPVGELSIQELKFDEEVFFLADPIANKFYESNKQMPEEEQDQKLKVYLAKYYEDNPQYLQHRFGSVLNVPEQYRKLLKLCMLNDNKIYFCGINQYAFRNLLSKIMTLKDTKQIFMMSLKYAAKQSYRWMKQQNQINKNNGKQQQIKNQGQKVLQTEQKFKLVKRLEDRYQIYARQIIYLKYYHIIKKIQNGQILKRISIISKDKSVPKPEKGRYVRTKKSGQLNQHEQGQNIVYFGNRHTIQSLQDYILIKDIQIFNPTKEQPKISSKNLQSPSSASKKSSKSTESDVEKIEKHSILEVMLGNLWNKAYTFNKFPYLSQNYHNLKNQDKAQVQSIYQRYVKQYMGIKKVYYKQNIEILEKEGLQKFDQKKFETGYEKAKKQYEEVIQLMKSKKQQKQQLNKKKSSKKQSAPAQSQQKSTKFTYKEQYEQDQQQLQKLINSLKTNPDPKYIKSSPTNKQQVKPTPQITSFVDNALKKQDQGKNINEESSGEEKSIRRGRAVRSRKSGSGENTRKSDQEK